MILFLHSKGESFIAVFGEMCYNTTKS